MKLAIVLLSWWGLSGVLPEATDEMPVPLTLQAALFKKIFDFDRTLQGRSDIVVAVVGTTDSRLSEELVTAFGAVGVRSQRVSPTELDERIGEFAVVYVPPGLDPQAVTRLCETNGVLSVSGMPDLVLGGHVAIGVGARNKKPEILVHLRRVKAERHDISAGLLEVARVIR